MTGAEQLGYRLELERGVGYPDPSSPEEQGPVGLDQHVGRPLDVLVVDRGAGPVPSDLDRLREGDLRLLLLHVLRDVQEDRARPPRLRYVEALLHRRRYLGRREGLEGVLRDWGKHPDDIGLLEAALARHALGDLPRYRYDRRRVGEGRRYPGDQVGRSRAGGGCADAGLPGDPAVRVRHVGTELFVPH